MSSSLNNTPFRAPKQACFTAELKLLADHIYFTLISTDSIAAVPDFWNGRRMGWGTPFLAMVLQRKVYSPFWSPGRSAAQWIFARRIGQARGWPVASSKPNVPRGIFPSVTSPQCFGGGRICASIHGALVKYGSPLGLSALLD